MKISELLRCIESKAPLAYQESYDNSGLITGDAEWDCTKALVCLDITEGVVREALAQKANLILSHHPPIFHGLKKILGTSGTERAIIVAIKNDIALYAAHTNLDNLISGVNGRIADRLALVNRRVLAPGKGRLEKMYVFVPISHAGPVRDALFAAGAGHIGAYSECSFGAEGLGTYTAGEGTQPFIGELGKRQVVKEIKLEVLFPAQDRERVVRELLRCHPYEEVAYDILDLTNSHPGIGSGLLGELPSETLEQNLLTMLRDRFHIPVIRHSPLLGRPARRLALCGGSGSFLISNALAAEADFFVSADLKYHQFFEAEGRMVIADIGHYESEQFTMDLLADLIREKFPTFAVLKTALLTNPVAYFL